MQYREYRNVSDADKEAWGDGAWRTEPDKVQWQDAETGYACLAVRNDSGAWCGYVGVPSSHPLHNVHYREVEAVFDVHGGLTFCGFCQENACEERSICHVVDDGEDDNVWWLGFDCNHFHDYAPAMSYTLRTLVHPEMIKRMPSCADTLKRYDEYRMDDVYRDLSYIKTETADLASQMREYEIAGKTAPKMTCTVAEDLEQQMQKLREYSARRTAMRDGGDFEPMNDTDDDA